MTEVLIATGIMAIGLVMVATIFPVGVKLTSLSTERTLGAVAADEAFAKIQLYGLRDFGTLASPNWPVTDPNVACSDYQYVTDYAGPDGLWGTFDDNYMQPGPDGFFGTGDDISWDSEFLYPSAAVSTGQDRNYHWSALCRRTGAKEVQVTVFVTRKIGAASQYHAWDYNVGTFTPIMNSPWPKPVPVNVNFTYSTTISSQNRELVINALTDPQTIQGLQSFTLAECGYFFDDGYTIVDNLTGGIYRILEVKDTNADNLPDTLVLMEDWEWDGYPLVPANGYTENRTIWVVPPAVGSDRYPCVGVYQKSIYFEDIN